MKQGKVLELFRILSNLGSQEAPMKLTIARNLTKFRAVVEDFETKREAKFEEVAFIDGKGNNVLTDEAMKLVSEGKMDLARAIPLTAYKFKEKDGAEKVTAYVEGLKNEDVEVEVETLLLETMVTVKDRDGLRDMSFEQYLESDLNKFPSADMAFMIDEGIIA